MKGKMKWRHARPAPNDRRTLLRRTAPGPTARPRRWTSSRAGGRRRPPPARPGPGRARRGSARPAGPPRPPPAPSPSAHASSAPHRPRLAPPAAGLSSSADLLSGQQRHAVSLDFSSITARLVRRLAVQITALDLPESWPPAPRGSPAGGSGDADSHHARPSSAPARSQARQAQSTALLEGPGPAAGRTAGEHAAVGRGQQAQRAARALQRRAVSRARAGAGAASAAPRRPGRPPEPQTCPTGAARRARPCATPAASGRVMARWRPACSAPGRGRKHWRACLAVCVEVRVSEQQLRSKDRPPWRGESARVCLARHAGPCMQGARRDWPPTLRTPAVCRRPRRAPDQAPSPPTAGRPPRPTAPATRQQRPR